MLVVFAVAAISFAAAGTVRADDAVPPTVTIQCSDGTVWVLDPTVMDVASFGDAICDGYVVVPQDPASDTGTGTYSADAAGTSDIGLGDFSLSSAMAPDPTQYVTEIQCPNGQVWAVASGDDFVCPAA
jgi:hypothetical protein